MTSQNEHAAVRIATRIADLSDDQFYAGIAQLREAKLPPLEALRLTMTALNEAGLPQRQLALRTTALVSAIRPNSNDILTLAELPLGIAIRTVLSTELPARLRPLFRKGVDRRLVPRSNEGESPAPKDGGTVLVATAFAEELPPSNTVVILSLAQQDMARSLLERRGYRPLLLSDRDRYLAELDSNADICGVLVDGSFLDVLGEDAQREIFQRTAQYSTFVWIRIAGAGLRLTVPEVRTLLKKERCQSRFVAAHELSIQVGSLVDSELEDLRRADDLLHQHENASFLPGELSPMERRVLVAAAHEWQERTNVNGPITVERLETRFLQGGFKTIRVASVLVNGARRPIIAKFSSKDQLVSELRRFQRYVQPIDNELDPILGYHGDAAVLLVTLVQREQHADEPAETLEDCLVDFRFKSWRTEDEPRSNLLLQSIRNAGYLLLKLNRQKAQADEVPCPIYLTNVEAAETLGITWGISGGSAASRATALVRFNRLAGAAVTHNDLHLRNLLVRGTDAHLIDYDSCGAGHPAVDLVRLEMALFSLVMFPLASDATHASMQERLSDPTVTFEAFAAEFNLSGQPLINRLCARGIFYTRDYALEAVKAHGGDAGDYLAAKYLVAWQNLLLDGRQVSMSRSTITALAPHFQ